MGTNTLLDKVDKPAGSTPLLRRDRIFKNPAPRRILRQPDALGAALLTPPRTARRATSRKARFSSLIAGVLLAFGTRLLLMSTGGILLMRRVLMVVASEMLGLLRWSFVLPSHEFSPISNCRCRKERCVHHPARCIERRGWRSARSPKTADILQITRVGHRLNESGRPRCRAHSN